MQNSAVILVRKLNEDRLAANSLCDYVIKTRSKTLHAHKCVLALSCDFFKKLFCSSPRHSKSFTFPIKTSPETIELAVLFLYANHITLNQENAYELLKMAWFLQNDLLHNYCAQYLVSSLTIENALKTWKYASESGDREFLSKCEQYVSKHFQHWVMTQRYLEFDFDTFKRFIQVQSPGNLQETIYEWLLNWIRYDPKARQKYFINLFEKIDLKKLPKHYLDFVILPRHFSSGDHQDHLNAQKMCASYLSQQPQPHKKISKSDNTLISNLQKQHRTTTSSRKKVRIHAFLRKSIQETQRSISFPEPLSNKQVNVKNKSSMTVRVMIDADEFMVVGGENSPLSLMKFNVLSKSWILYPDLQDRITIDAGLAFVQKVLYIIGGRSKDYKDIFDNLQVIEFQNGSHTVKKLAGMQEKRYKFGCTMLDHKIYVAGGVGTKEACLGTVESYSMGRNEWEERPAMMKKRGGCSLLAKGGVLYAIGGRQSSEKFHRSVEIFNGIEWQMGDPMLVRRTELASVILNGIIYAIGGRSAPGIYCNSVERFEGSSWKQVARLNHSRAGCSACVLDGKIFVIGGTNCYGPVKSMEVYDPLRDDWYVFGDLIGDPLGASMIAITTQNISGT